MGIDGLIKVLMFLDECLNIISFGVHFFCLQEGFTGRHPVLCLFTVSVEELQLQTLVKLHTTCNPSPENV
jgi:hypothetical protein